MQNSYDVVVIGGGAAGLAASLSLGRSRRSVLVVDAGEPRNAPAAGVHNYLGREGTPPADLVAIGRDEVAAYGVDVTAGRLDTAWVEPVEPGDPVGFRVRLASGQVVAARRLVVATGAVDVLPAIPGLAEQWGRGVVHCPYCHGWEIRDRRIGVLMTGPGGAHHAMLFRQLTGDLTVFVTDPALASDELRAQWAARGVRVVDGPVASVVSDSSGALTGVVLASGSTVPIDALAAASTVEARVEGLADLGLRAVDQEMQGTRIGSALEVGPTGETAVRGVYAAGNVTQLTATVIAASAAGTTAGAVVNADLAAADTEAAVARMRNP